MLSEPIVLDDNGDVMIFESVADAERYVEAIDVEAGVYQGYDAAGRRLKLDIVKDATQGKSPKKVAITVDASKASDEEGLRKQLLSFLARMGVPQSAELPTSDLLEALRRGRRTQ